MRSLIALAALAATSLATADIHVSDAWVRATPPAARTAAVYFTLSNDGAADALVGAETDAADLAEIHAVEHADGMVRMKQLLRLPIPPGGRAELRPDGNHLMLVSLRRDLEPGRTIRLRLLFERGEPVELDVPVKDARQ